MTIVPTTREPVARNDGAVDKRQAILRASTHMFAQKGYFNSQVADIARADRCRSRNCVPLFSE